MTTISFADPLAHCDHEPPGRGRSGILSRTTFSVHTTVSASLAARFLDVPDHAHGTAKPTIDRSGVAIRLLDRADCNQGHVVDEEPRQGENGSGRSREDPVPPGHEADRHQAPHDGQDVQNR